MNDKARLTKIIATLAAALGAAATIVTPGFADRLDEMISPISNPVNFEDPRAITEIRPLFLYHKLDDKFVTQGGHVMGGAVQVRFALDDRFAIIATKDGFLHLQPNAVVPDGTGFANVAAGAKYAFYKDGDAGQIMTAGLRYEIPLGDKDVLQGNGDGVFNPFLSAGAALGPVNLMAYSAFRLPVSSGDSSFFDADLHVSTKVGEMFYPTFEVNLHHVLDAGNRLGIPDEGADFFNIGSSLSDGKTLVTGSVGVRARLSKDIDTGVSYQFPMNSGEGTRIYDWRITTDLIYRFNLC